MSLFGSIQMAGNTLQAMQIGLHVVGNNIANANTPGYIRERTIYTPAPTMKSRDSASLTRRPIIVSVNSRWNWSP